MQSKRKAQLMQRAMIMAVFSVVVLLILIFVPRLTTQTAESAAMRAACEKSLDIQNNLRIFGDTVADNMGELSTINCATEYVEVDVPRNPSEKEWEKVTMQIADHSFKCWDLYGDKDRLFAKGTGIYCMLCRSIDITDGTTLRRGLVGYMGQTRAPNVEGGTYIQAMGGADDFRGAEESYNFYSFKPKTDTAIIVTYGGKLDAPYLVYNSRTQIGMIFYPYDEIGKLNCYRLEGRANSMEFMK
jgi:hypothetical protein